MDSYSENSKFSRCALLSSSDSSESGETERLIQLFHSCDRDQDGLIDKLDLLTMCERAEVGGAKRAASFCYEDMVEELGLRDDSARVDCDKFLRCRRRVTAANTAKQYTAPTSTETMSQASGATRQLVSSSRCASTNASTLPFSAQRGSRFTSGLCNETQKECVAQHSAVLESSASDNSLVSGSGDQYDSGAQDLAGEPMSLLALLRKAQPALHLALCDVLHLNDSRSVSNVKSSGSTRSRDDDAGSLNDCLNESLLRNGGDAGDLGSCRSLVDEYELRECVARALSVCNALHLDALSALKRELHEHAALVRQANARCAKLERDCERFRSSRSRMESEKEALVARYEDRLTELHSVIVEQHRKLEAATQRGNVNNVIYEEDEEDVDENENDNENETETSSEREDLDEPAESPCGAKQQPIPSQVVNQPVMLPQLDTFQPIAIAPNSSNTQSSTVARPSPTRTRTPPVLLGARIQELRVKPRAAAPHTAAQTPAGAAAELKSPSDPATIEQMGSMQSQSSLRSTSAASVSASESASGKPQTPTQPLTQAQTHALLSAQVRTLEDAAHFVEYLATISTNGALSDRLAECTFAIERVAITSADREAYVRLLQTQLNESRNRRELHALAFGAACANLERQLSRLDRVDTIARQLNRVSALRRRARAVDRAAMAGVEADWLADELAAAAAAGASSIFESRFDRLDEASGDYVPSDEDDDLVSTMDDNDSCGARSSESMRIRLARRIITELDRLSSELEALSQPDTDNGPKPLNRSSDDDSRLRDLYSSISSTRRQVLSGLRSIVADLRVTDAEVERAEPEAGVGESEIDLAARKPTIMEASRASYPELCYEMCNLENELAAVKHEKLELKTRLYYTEKEVTLWRWRSESEKQRCSVSTAELEHVRSENQLLKSLITDSASTGGQSTRIVEELEAQRAKLLELTSTISGVVDDAQTKQEQTVQLVAELKQTNFALIRAFERVKSKYQVKIKTQQERIRQLLSNTQVTTASTPNVSAGANQNSAATPTPTSSSADTATMPQTSSKQRSQKQSASSATSTGSTRRTSVPQNNASVQLSDSNSNSNSSLAQRHALNTRTTGFEPCGTPSSLSSRSTGTPTHTPALTSVSVSHQSNAPLFALPVANSFLLTTAPYSANDAVFIPRHAASPGMAMPTQHRVANVTQSQLQPQQQPHLPSRSPSFTLAGLAPNQPLGIGVGVNIVSPTTFVPVMGNAAVPLLRPVNAPTGAMVSMASNVRPAQPIARRPQMHSQTSTQGTGSGTGTPLSETTI